MQVQNKYSFHKYNGSENSEETTQNQSEDKEENELKKPKGSKIK